MNIGKTKDKKKIFINIFIMNIVNSKLKSKMRKLVKLDRKYLFQQNNIITL